MEISAVLFDSDGVLTLPEDAFDVVYARSHGLDSEPFKNFFRQSGVILLLASET